MPYFGPYYGDAGDLAWFNIILHQSGKTREAQAAVFHQYLSRFNVKGRWEMRVAFAKELQKRGEIQAAGLQLHFARELFEGVNRKHEIYRYYDNKSCANVARKDTGGYVWTRRNLSKYAKEYSHPCEYVDWLSERKAQYERIDKEIARSTSPNGEDVEVVLHCELL